MASLASSSNTVKSAARLDGLDLVLECVGGGGVGSPPSLVGVDGS